MNNLSNQKTVDTSHLTPIEIALGIDENGMTTARKLYEFLDLSKGQFSRWAKTSIENNEFYGEGKDWWGFDIMSSGNTCKDYKLTTDFAKHLSMESHSAKGKIARDYFVTVEDKTKEMVLQMQEMSPQLQFMINVELEQKRQAKEQERQAAELETIKENQQTIAEALAKPAAEGFRSWVNRCLSAIAECENYLYIGNMQQRHSAIRAESYERLNWKRPCRLEQRVKRAKGEAAAAGASRTQINAINKLSVIEADRDLKPVYESVIREMLIAYRVNV